MYRAELLGRFRLLVSGEPIEFPTARVRELAAYLAWHLDEWVSRERLHSMLWPDSPEERAQASLRQSIYRLKLALRDGGIPGALEARRASVRLTSSGGLRTDARDFRDAAGKAAAHPDLSAAIKALALYGGPFLEDLDCEWAAPERDELAELHLETLRRVVACLSEAGLTEAAIPHARRWVEAEPFDEEARRTLMRLFVASGAPTRALQQFEDLRVLLDRELGIAPEADTLELLRSIGLDPRTPRRRGRVPRPTHEEIARSVSDDPQYKAGLLVALGTSKGEIGETEEAIEALSAARRVYEGLQDEEGLARVALGMAGAHVGNQSGPRPDLAVPHIESALAYFREAGDSPLACRALYLGAFIAGACDDADGCSALAAEGLEMAGRLGSRDYESRFETVLAARMNAERRLAACDEALTRVSRSLPYMTDPSDIADFLTYYATVALLKGELKVAEVRFRELFALAQTLPMGVARATAEIPARLLLMTTYYFEGKQAQVRRLNPLPEMGAFLPEHAAYCVALMLRPKDLPTACRAAATVLKANLPVIMPEQICLFIQELYEFMSEAGLHDAALEWADTGIDLCRKSAWPAARALFEAYRARALAYAGDFERAAESLHWAAAHRDAADRWTELLLLWTEAMLERGAGDREGATASFARATDMAHELGFAIYLPQIAAAAAAR